MNEQTTKLGVTNDNSEPLVVYVEPCGADYTLLPGESLEIIVIGVGLLPLPWFSVIDSPGALSAYIEGSCGDFAVFQGGHRIECGHNRRT